MPEYLDEEELTAPKKQATEAYGGIEEEYLDESELYGPAPSRNLAQQFGDFITDPEELKGMGKRALGGAATVGKATVAAADMVLGLPGQAASVATDLYTRGESLVKGTSRAERDAAIQERKAQIPFGWTAPLQSLGRMGGVEPADQAIVEHSIEKGAALVDRYSGGLLNKQDAQSLLEATMFGGFARVPGQAVKQALAPKERLGTAERATYAEEPVEGFEPRGMADRGTTPTPLTPEEAIARSKARVKDLKKALADKDVVAQLDELATARQLGIGEAKLGEDTVQITGEPKRGADGKLYSTVVKDGTTMEVPSSELAAKPQVGLEHLAPKPFEPAAGVKTRMTEGTVLGEKPTAMATGLEKVRAGREFDLLADEKIAVNAVQKAAGQIVDQNGKPLQLQRGQIDQRLLAALGIGSAATFMMLNPEKLGELGAVGLIGSTMLLGKDRTIGAHSKRTGIYSFPTIDALVKAGEGKTEFGAQQVLDFSKKASAEEQALVKRVVGDKKTITADELVGGMLEETAGWKFEAEKTAQYGDYGLDSIERASKGKYPELPGQEPVGFVDDAVTTKYRLPEHMQMTDANHFKDSRLFGWTRSFKEDGVRHVVEIQSDLAQRARGALEGEAAVAATKELGDVTRRFQALKERYAQLEQIPLRDEAAGSEWRRTRTEMGDLLRRREELRVALEATAVDTQLSPILKNWPRRLIREELAGAAKEGEGTVRFASADTVAKVEGWPLAKEGFEPQDSLAGWIRDVNAKLAGEGKPPLNERQIGAAETRLENAWKAGQRFDDPGHAGLYLDYAGDTSRYLKGLGGKEVTDAQGHTWIEVPTSAVQTPLGPRVKMLGKADPKVLAAMAAAGLGAAGGYAMADEYPALKAIAGAGAGVALVLGGKSLAHGLDVALGRGSTRVSNIDPTLTLTARNMEMKASQDMARASEQIHGFTKAVKKLPTETQAAVEKAYLEGDHPRVQALIRTNPEAAKGYAQVRQFIDQIGETLRGFERFGKGIADHLPRVVKDHEGLLNALGHEKRSAMEEVLAKAEARSTKVKGRPLSDVERSIVIDNFMLKDPQLSHQPGFAKNRTIKMTDELQKFYYPMEESLVRYAHAAVEDVATARFFGKDLRTTAKGNKKFTNVEQSIGAMIDRLRQEKKLTPEQEMNLRDVLLARFGKGEQAPKGWLQDVRNVTGIGMLGQVGSGLIQSSESLFSFYHHGLMPPLQAVVTMLRGKGISPAEFGLSNHLIEETISKRPTGEALSLVLKANLLSTLDQFGMRQNLNASFHKNQALARTAAGQKTLMERWEPFYKEQTPQLIKDLQQATTTKRSQLVDSLLYGELSNIRPTSRFEMPQLYNEHPNGRFLYQFRQFMLVQADIIRRDAYNKIKTGEPKKVAEGVKNLALFGAVLATATVPAEMVKDWISGRSFDFDKIDYVENIAKNFGINRYTADKIIQSKTPGKALVEAGEGLLKPPAVGMAERIGEGLSKPEKFMTLVPLVGRPLYDRALGGNEARKIAEMKQQRRKDRDAREAKNPALKRQRLERERKAKERAYDAAKKLP